MSTLNLPTSLTIIGLGGSPIPEEDGTDYVVKEALSAAAEIPGIKTEFYSLKDYKIGYCDHCDACKNYYLKNGYDRFYCKKKDDALYLYERFFAADGYILGSPAYVYDIPGVYKSFMDRFYAIMHVLVNGHLRLGIHKVGASIAVSNSPYDGQLHVLEALHTTLSSFGILTVGGQEGLNTTVNTGGKGIAGAMQDREGMENIRKAGREVAEISWIGAKGYSKLMSTRQ